MSDHRVTTYIGLGSNLEQPRDQVELAFDELARLPNTQLIDRSSLYRTHPVGPQDQPDFINAVARLQTGLAAEVLLDELQELERLHRRVRNGLRWGPRTLDLDLLLYGQERISSQRLAVPHPEMGVRAFVLAPLAEIAPPDLTIPGMGRLDALLQAVNSECIQPLD